MRIIHTIGFPLRMGGHIRSGLSLIRNLNALGFESVVVAPGGGSEETQREYASVAAEIRLLSGLQLQDRVPSRRLALALRSLISADRCELIHSHDWRSAATGHLAAGLARKPFVLSIAGGPFDGQRPPAGSATIVFSEELRSGIQEAFGPIGRRLHLVRARIDRELFRPLSPRKDFLDRYCLPVEGISIAMAVRLVEGKRPWIETMLDLASKYRRRGGVRIILVGEGPLAAELRQRASELETRGYDPVLRVLGPLQDSQDVSQLYNYANVVVGSGRGILEAMACGKPVIVLGERGEGEFVSFDNVQEIAHTNFSGRHFRKRRERTSLEAALSCALDREQILADLGRWSYAFIRDHMDARMGAEEVARVYREAAETPVHLSDFLRWRWDGLVDGLRRAAGRRWLSRFQRASEAPVR